MEEKYLTAAPGFKMYSRRGDARRKLKMKN